MKESSEARNSLFEKQKEVKAKKDVCVYSWCVL